MSVGMYLEKIKSGQLLSLKQINHLCEKSVQIFIQEPNVIAVPQGEHYIVGDIHGQFYDLIKMIDTVCKYKNYLSQFKGSYKEKVQYYQVTMLIEDITPFKPSVYYWLINVYILRNHETSSLTRIYGFYDQVQKKYGNLNAWKKIVDTFNYLPLTAILGQQLLCVHGGLSPNIPLIDEIDYIQRIRQIPETGNMCDLVWSDPDLNIQNWSISNRGAGYLFSKQIVKQFLYMNGLETIARAHQLVEEGHTYNFQQKTLVTVWSAPNYCYRCGNQACVMKINEHNDHEFINFTPAVTQTKQKIHYDHILPYFL